MFTNFITNKMPAYQTMAASSTSTPSLSSLYSQPTTQTQQSSSTINPLTGQPYSWSTQYDYGSLNRYLFGGTEQRNDGDGSSWEIPIYGAMDYIQGNVPNSGDDSAFDPMFSPDVLQTLAEKYGAPGYTFADQEEGRMKRRVVLDSAGNVVWAKEPHYEQPGNFFKDVALPMAAFAVGAPLLGSLAGVAIPAGTPTLASIFGGASAVSSEMLSAANASADPIATLNASAGWTGVDAGYLSSLGGNLTNGSSILAQQQAPNIAAEAVIPEGVPTLESLGAPGGALSAEALPTAAISGGLPAALGPAVPGAVAGSSSALPSGVQGLLQNTAIKTLLSQLLGQGSGGTGSLLSNLAGMYSASQNQSDLGDLENMFTGMYGQNSPYAQTLRQNLDRRDAAAGRRSQYGPREVELQAKLADQTSRNAMAISNLRVAAGGQRNALLNNGLQGLDSLFGAGGSGGNILSQLSSLFSGTNWNEMSPEDVSNWQTIIQNNPNLYSPPNVDIPIPDVDYEE